MATLSSQGPSCRSAIAMRVKMVVAYDGSGFHGFAENAGVRTVGGTLREALEQVLRQPVELTAAGRTDTGVHAWGQVVSFDAPADGLDLARLARSVNGLCGPAIAVARRPRWPRPDFDARFSARWRHYRYTVLNREAPDPFLARDVVARRRAPGLPAAAAGLRSAHRRARLLVVLPPPAGRAGRAAEPPMERRVLDAALDRPRRRRCCASRSGPTPSATRWCARSSGCWSTSGTGRRHAGDVLAILRARDRSLVGQLAPPHGLCLWEVGYESASPLSAARAPAPAR